VNATSPGARRTTNSTRVSKFVGTVSLVIAGWVHSVEGVRHVGLILQVAYVIRFDMGTGVGLRWTGLIHHVGLPSAQNECVRHTLRLCGRSVAELQEPVRHPEG
jgi:hypothetical protein